MLKKMICALLCAMLIFLTACASAEPEASAAPESPEQTPAVQPEETEEAEEPEDAEEPAYYTQDSAEYRDLYANNAIEEALDEQFSSAMTTEDFDALAKTYVTAWKEEYHALMDQLIALYPDDADDLNGLRDYTDQAAQEAYEAAYAQHFYIDEEGNEQPAAAAEQNANFEMAEAYKQATVLSILNDYREETPYLFHYTAQ